MDREKIPTATQLWYVEANRSIFVPVTFVGTLPDESAMMFRRDNGQLIKAWSYEIFDSEADAIAYARKEAERIESIWMRAIAEIQTFALSLPALAVALPEPETEEEPEPVPAELGEPVGATQDI